MCTYNTRGVFEFHNIYTCILLPFLLKTLKLDDFEINTHTHSLSFSFSRATFNLCVKCSKWLRSLIWISDVTLKL